MAQGPAPQGGSPFLIVPEFAERRCIDFIKKEVGLAHAKGAVVGVSGGVDSAVVLALCVKALGADNVRAAVMPSDSTPNEDTDDAMALCKSLGVPTIVFNVMEVVYAFRVPSNPKVAYGNLKARVRMSYLYWLANTGDALVVGTGDRSEDQIGFFSKYGDGGVDINPLQDLYKTEVRLLATHLGIPESIVSKPSSPRLWGNHTAKEELGAGYEEIDAMLELFERGVFPHEPLAYALRKRIKDNAHKLRPPPFPRFR